MCTKRPTVERILCLYGVYFPHLPIFFDSKNVSILEDWKIKNNECQRVVYKTNDKLCTPFE